MALGGETDLGRVLNADDPDTLASYLTQHLLDPNESQPSLEQSNLVQWLAKSRDNSACLSWLLQSQVNLEVDRPHPVNKRRALHEAAEAGWPHNLRALLVARADVNGRLRNGNTPLHLVAIKSAVGWELEPQLKSARAAQYAQCLRVLCDWSGVEVDAMNQLGATPLYLAAKRGSREAVAILLARGADPQIEVDGEVTHELIERLYPDLARTQTPTVGPTSADKLFNLLYQGTDQSQDQFIAAMKSGLANNNGPTWLTHDNGRFTFLQYACDQGLVHVARFLLAVGANPNDTCPNNRMAPILWAAHHGFAQILELFCQPGILETVDWDTVDSDRRENIIHKALKRQARGSTLKRLGYADRDYDECMALILERGQIPSDSFNALLWAQDNWGNTPLHFATELDDHVSMLKLIQKGSDLSVTNKRGQMAALRMSPEIWSDFLDGCIQGEGLPMDNDFEVSFSYDFLAAKNTTEPEFETQALHALASSEPHHPIFLHPVVTSFLYLKWRRLRHVFYTNLILHLLLCLALTCHLVLAVADESLADWKVASRICLWVALLPILVRDVVIVACYPLGFLARFDNWVEILVLAISIYVACVTKVDLNWGGIVIILTWGLMVVFMGRHPKLSVYIKMFYTVSLNFSLFLLWYILFILAFAFAFFLIFHSGDNEHFATLEKSIFKTLVMSLTGELEYENINFGGRLGLAIFLLYVFFVILVLINLLNGLAISDITEIRQRAEILSYISRTQLLAYTERLLWGQHCPSRTLQCWQKTKGSIWRGFNSLLLLNGRLPRQKAVFLPNQSLHEASLPGAKKDNLILDGLILNEAKKLVVAKLSSSWSGHDHSSSHDLKAKIILSNLMKKLGKATF